MTLPGRRLARRAAEGLMRRDLPRTFRRVVWVGAPPVLPEGPVVLYANHHYFHDSYLFWHLVTDVLDRRIVVWMEAWEQAPLFGPAGALPFPLDDPKARAATVRETVRRMEADPRTTLLLYPEGALRPPGGGLGPFRADLARLARLLPQATRWWPVGAHLTWWGEDRPTALLAAGAAHEAPDGREAERLEALLAHLRTTGPDVLDDGTARVLIEGRKSPHERWNLAPLAPLFRRWT